MVFRLLHYFVVVIVSLLVAMVSSLLFFLFIPTKISSNRVEGSLETASLPPQGRWGGGGLRSLHTLPSPYPTCGISLGMQF